MQHTRNIVVGDNGRFIVVPGRLPLRGPRRLLQLFKFVRLLRKARLFVTPELELVKITPAEAKRMLTEEVGMSPHWADLELRRYMWDSPGQAPSYYYGYMKLRKIREQSQNRLGKDFAERCFHDAILDVGLVPLSILAERMQTLKCSKR